MGFKFDELLGCLDQALEEEGSVDLIEVVEEHGEFEDPMYVLLKLKEEFEHCYNFNGFLISKK